MWLPDSTVAVTSLLQTVSSSDAIKYLAFTCTGGIIGLALCDTKYGIYVRKVIKFVCGGGARGPQIVFDLEHQLLNLVTRSTWVNLGYWKDATTYTEACEGLADRLALQAGLKEGDHILDVGFGCGDQDLYLYHKYKLGRISGVNVSKAQVAVAQGRVSDLGLSDAIQLDYGTANRLEFPGGSFDKVLSLDSAYHYNTRETFFKEAYGVLKPGGVLAIADMVPQKMPSNFFLRGLCAILAKMSLVPDANLYDLNGYISRLKDAGYVNIQVDCIEEHVFNGFADFIKRHRNEFDAVTPPALWPKYTSTASTLRTAARKNWFHYIMVHAEKPQG